MCAIIGRRQSGIRVERRVGLYKLSVGADYGQHEKRMMTDATPATRLMRKGKCRNRTQACSVMPNFRRLNLKEILGHFGWLKHERAIDFPKGVTF